MISDSLQLDLGFGLTSPLRPLSKRPLARKARPAPVSPQLSLVRNEGEPLLLQERVWQLPASMDNLHLGTWLQRWPATQGRWVSFISPGKPCPELLRQLREAGMPALVLRPQPGHALEALVEHTLKAGRSDAVIAPRPQQAGWVERYAQAADASQTLALLI